jgi:signal transduction histidine kinase
VGTGDLDGGSAGTDSDMLRFNAELDRLMQARRDDALSLADFLKTVTRSITRLLGVTRASVWWLEDEGQTLRCAGLFESEHDRFSSGSELQAGDYPQYFEAFGRARVIAAHDAPTDPGTREFAHGYLDTLGITSMLDAQISNRDGLRGVVCCEHTGAPRRWTAEEMAFVGSVADYTGLALELKERGEMADALSRANAELRTAIEAAKAAQAVAERANRLQSQFLANTSHELRTPLHGVLGGLAILRADTRPEVREHWLGLIERSGRWLLGSVNSILDMAAIEDGALVLNPSRFELADALGGAAAALRPGEDTTRIRVQIEPDARNLGPLFTDRNRLERVVGNLLDNAVKFAPDSPITLRASAAFVISNGVRVAVEDEGPGVSEHLQEAIFDRFLQADGSTHRQHGGSGLGLAISREYITRMGGQLAYLPREGGGSIFWFELPLELPEVA